MVAIEQIQPGTLVPSYSPIDRTLSFRPVISVDRRPSRSLVTLRIGEESILVTPDHPFATLSGGWVAARELRKGEALFNLHGDDVSVSSVEDTRTDSSSTPWVYNLRVEGVGTYFVGQSHVLVNSCVAPVDLVAQRRARMDVAPGGLLGEGFPMVIHNALVPNLSLVSSGPTTNNLDLPCLPIGRWSLLIGERDGYLVILDNEDHSIKMVAKDLLRRIAAGGQECTEKANLIAARMPLGHNDVAFDGVIADDRVYLSYFAGRRVEVFELPQRGEGPLPLIRFQRQIPIKANDRPGLSSIAVWRDRLWATDVNWICDVPNCNVRFGSSRLFTLDLSSGSHRITRPATSVSANAGGLYLHEPSDSLYLIGAGNSASRSSIVQRIEPNGPAGSAITLPKGAAVERGYRINDGVFAVLQLSGHYVFVIDASNDTLLTVQRFDGERFHKVPISTDALAQRSDAVLRQVIPDPGSTGRFYLVDSKGEQIIYVAYDPSLLGFRTLGRFPLGKPGSPRAPNWGVSLRE